MKNLSKPVAITIYVISFLLLVGLAVGNYYADKYSQIITTYLGHSNSEIVDSDDADTINSEYYKSDYQSSDEVHEYSAQVGQKIVEEGAVLLKNENDTLPLSAGDRISVLGQNSVDLIYGGGGSGSVDTSKAPDLLTVLNSSGFNVNETLWEFYDTGAGSSYRKELPDLYGEGDYAVNEVPLSDYTDDVMSSLEDYNDAAVVVIGRAGNESSDLTTESLSTGYHYLQLDDTEEEMLQFALDSFETVVVVLNTSNPMELGFLDEYDIDAALWIGALGQSGAYAIGEILNGSVNPSGRLVDTYAFDVKSAPAMANFGDFNITNSEVSMGNKYMVYGEGIYIGYRYYETRYEDVVLGNENIDNFDYESQVQFPFGYGLSYSTFEWSDYSVTEGDDTFEVP
ncbi:glycoside hydrolase family 3 C-terminal domain-containing protein [Bacillus sp. JCM 19034]|uniref:glycoside hydrolase family 3 protein n=1 Tax=Bacillus sp. JCM 19034 TaxID=1481928 RepID=UPI00078350B8|nr:glycoside hydrolase family 3 C-terminal domain-containing protein [Bacillus sp. JCM 19034]